MAAKFKDPSHLQEQARQQVFRANTAAKAPGASGFKFFATGCLEGEQGWLATARENRCCSAVGPPSWPIRGPSKRGRSGGPLVGLTGKRNSMGGFITKNKPVLSRNSYGVHKVLAFASD